MRNSLFDIVTDLHICIASLFMAHFLLRSLSAVNAPVLSLKLMKRSTKDIQFSF